MNLGFDVVAISATDSKPLWPTCQQENCYLFAHQDTGLSQRPATYPQLGQLIRALRPDGMTLREADKIGRKRGVTDMSYSFLARLERGELKHPPTPEQVRGLATIYGTKYPALAARVAASVYELQLEIISGHGLISPAVGVESTSTTEPGTYVDPSRSPENIALLKRIRTEVSALDLQLRRIDEAVAAAEVKAGIADLDDSSAIGHSESIESSTRRVDRQKRTGTAR